MALLLKYVRETGAIVGNWESTNLAVLQAQRVEHDPVHGYLLSLDTLPASVLEQNYRVVDGVVELRPSEREG